jgi:cytochrome o ubiquinol oxidase operon protein cyoD
MHEKLTIKPYVIGFILSLVLTFGAFFLVNQHVASGHSAYPHELIITIILVLAVAQLFVQLFFFLHMGKEKGPKWNLFVFATFISLILLIVIASLWIMYHLNYNMSSHQMGQTILEKEMMVNPGYSNAEKQQAIQDRHD